MWITAGRTGQRLSNRAPLAVCAVAGMSLKDTESKTARD